MLLEASAVRFWMRQIKLPELSFQRGSWLFLSVMLLIVPFPWLAAAWTAAFVHELCHMIALKWMGHPVAEIHIGIFGARIRTTPLPPLDELVCALAGPFGALLLLPFARWIPLVCLFGAAQSFFNLIPVYPMDGGRALRSALGLLGLGDAVFDICETVLCAVVLAMGIWASWTLKFGMIPIVTSLCIVFPAVWKK